MPQDRLTELKLYGISLMKKVHKTKIFRNLEEKQALQVQDNAKKTQQLCGSCTVLWKLFREKAQIRWISISTLSNLQKDKHAHHFCIHP